MSLRVAVVGLGKMGLLHASLLRILPDVELVALCEKSSLVRSFARKLFRDISVVPDLSVIAHSDLDAVYVTTPPGAHSAIVGDIFQRGLTRNIFVEKPLALSYVEAEALCRQVAGKGCQMVGYNRRFAVTFQKAYQLLASNAIGELHSFKGHADSADFVGIKGKGHSTALSRGGVIRDLGCHLIDMALWIFGNLNVKTARIDSITGEASQDAASFSVSTAEGLTGEFQCSWCREDYRLPEIGFRVEGSEGVLSVDDDKVVLEPGKGSSSLWYCHDLGDNVAFFLGGSDYYREDELFIRSIQNGQPVEPGFNTALQVHEVIEQIEEKARGNG